MLGENIPSNLTPWYSGSGSAEGVGTGWFYSVLGGGKDKHPKLLVDRVPVSFDNTLESRMRGDYAVSTLFNGNFDAVFQTPIGIFRRLLVLQHFALASLMRFLANHSTMVKILGQLGI